MTYVKIEDKDKLAYFYKLTASSSTEKYEHSKEIYCAVVSCTSDSPKSCGRRFVPSDNVVPSIKFTAIKINMIVELETEKNDYLVMPNHVDFTILPLSSSEFTFDRSSVYSVME